MGVKYVFEITLFIILGVDPDVRRMDQLIILHVFLRHYPIDIHRG